MTQPRAAFDDLDNEGVRRGIITALLIVLQARGLSPTTTLSAHLREVVDADMLKIWLERAATARSRTDLYSCLDPRGRLSRPVNWGKAEWYVEMTLQGTSGTPAEELLEAGIEAHEYEYMSRYRRRRHMEGAARSILLVLEGRGLTVPDELNDRLRLCDDPAQLDQWSTHAGTIEHAADLLSV